MNICEVLQTRLTDDSDIPPLEPTITVKGGIFAIKGDISFVSGLAKSGKSTLCRYMIATALMESKPIGFDNLGIEATYCEGRPVVYIDTEQPKVFTMKAKDEIKRLLDTKRLPENLHIFNWRHHSHKENRDALEKLFPHFWDAALWIIDGVTDFLGSANDEEKGNELIRFFMQQADNLGTTIVLLIHENQNTGKLRGHLGSEAERKCGGAISVKKDRETKTHWIHPKLLRGSADFDSYAFQFDESQTRFVTLNDAKTRELRSQLDKKENKLNELHKLAQSVYGETIRMNKADLIKGLRLHVQRKDTQSEEAYRKTIDRTFKDLLETYNVISALGEPKDSYKYLSLNEVEPVRLNLETVMN